MVNNQLSQLSWRTRDRLGELHGQITGNVAMSGHFWALKGQRRLNLRG